MPIRIDFVSDIVCPWCAIGLLSLERAIGRLAGTVEVELHFQPFELNPRMAPGGEDATSHLVRKYGSTPAAIEEGRERIRARGAELGFTFNARERIWNTFDAHRLLYWAGLESAAAQRALEHALLRACFTDGLDVSSHAVLERVAAECGLEAARAAAVLASGQHAAEVREREQWYVARGIHAVPATILDERRLVSGGQPPEVFEQALREAAGVR
jgi:predicted DsbA family dithiol-disulfide isomerase